MAGLWKAMLALTIPGEKVVTVGKKRGMNKTAIPPLTSPIALIAFIQT